MINYINHYWHTFFFLCIWITVGCHFISLWRNSFSLFYKTGLLTMNSLKICMYKFCLHFWKIVLLYIIFWFPFLSNPQPFDVGQHSELHWPVLFTFLNQYFEHIIHWLLASIAIFLRSKLLISLRLLSVYFCFQDFFLCLWTFDYFGIDLFGSILLWDHWAFLVYRLMFS